jgi:hypothetical protein
MSIMDVANTCVYFPSLAIFLMYTLLMQLLTIAKLLFKGRRKNKLKGEKINGKN